MQVVVDQLSILGCMNQDVEMWTPDEGSGDHTGEDNTNPSAEAFEDELAARSAQVRLWSTGKLQQFLENLEPYVDGSLGPVSPRHAATYLQGLREMNRLWGAAWSPPKITAAQRARIEREAAQGVLDQWREQEAQREELEAQRRRERVSGAREAVLGQLSQIRSRDS